MAKKDPAFLFYPKDWIQGTAKLMPDEKGVYIDLLAHQHQDKDLPNDTKRLSRIVGLSESDFLQIWDNIKDKFTVKDNRLHNRKLTELTTERLEKGRKNKIIGTLAAVVRLSDATYDLKFEAKKNFDYTEFLSVKDTELTESITEWFTKRLGIRLKSIANANANNKEGLLNNNTVIDNIEGKEKKVFNTMPLNSDFNGLPDVHNLNTIQILKLTKQVIINSETVDGLWEAFKIQTLTGKKHYHNKEEVYTHFTNWMKKQNFENGNTKTNNGNSNIKLGTSEARVDALKKW